MIKSLCYTPGNEEILVTNDVPKMINLPQPQQTQWLNIVGSENNEIKVLKDIYSFNELSIADSLRERHPPKFELFQDYVFIILRPIHYRSDSSCDFKQLSLFLGENYLISKTFEPVSAVETNWTDYEHKNFDITRSVRHILYKIFSKVSDDYFNLIYKIESRLEEIEDLLEKDTQEIYLTELTKINSTLRKVVRNLEYQEKVALKLIQHEESNQSDQISHEYKDVHEQIDRTLSLAKLYQNLCNDLINAHISITSHKVNQVVKILTIVTVLFLPLSFIVGLYGMNFEFIPELKLKYGYFYVLGFMVIIEIFLIILLRKLKWI